MTVSVVKEIIQHYNENNSTVFASFIDLSKGFDKVNHFKLLDLIWETNLNNGIKKVLREFLLNQTANVSYNSVTSESYKIGNGVRQGGVNSPLLFNYYLSFLVKELCEMKIGCKFALNYYPIISYADDLVIMAPSQHSLQKLLDCVCMRLNDLSLTINGSKTKIVVFGRKNKVSSAKFYINKEILENVDSIKYLGVILQSDLGNRLDIERLERAFLRQAFACLNKYSNFPINVKTFLFKTYCMSLYGCQLWDNLKGCSNNMAAIKVSYHKAIKRILGLPFRSSSHQACVTAGFHTLNHKVNYKMFSFGYQIQKSSSPCIRSIKNFLLRSSYWVKRVTQIGNKEYEIRNFLEFDQATIFARINFKFNREPRYEGYPWNDHRVNL